MSNQSNYWIAPAALMLALVISGCSGGGDGGSDGTNTSSNNAGNDTGGLSSINSDSFLSRVNSIIGNNSETAEPESVESITVTNPENKAPASIN